MLFKEISNASTDSFRRVLFLTYSDHIFDLFRFRNVIKVLFANSFPSTVSVDLGFVFKEGECYERLYLFAFFTFQCYCLTKSVQIIDCYSYISINFFTFWTINLEVSITCCKYHFLKNTKFLEAYSLAG